MRRKGYSERTSDEGLNVKDLGGNGPSGDGPIVGIDLGTTNCAASIYTAATVPTLLQLGGASRYTMPSCVMWNGGDNYVVGVEAYNQRYKKNVVYSVKRQMGTDDKIILWLGRESITLSPVQVSCIILKEIKRRVRELCGELDRAIITVPAYFNHRQIEDTLEAGKLAGWDVVNILKEPTSASYVYSNLGYADKGSVLVYDLGGGTFDATYLTFLRQDTVDASVLKNLEKLYGITIRSEGADVTDQYFCRVLATFGDTRLGGDDIDREMAGRVLAKSDSRLTDEEFEKLILRCEDFKKLGLVGQTVDIEGKLFNIEYADLTYAVDKIFAKTMGYLREFDKSKINTVVLVGGSTKNEYLRGLLRDSFPDSEISAVLDPDAAVALGAGAVAKAMSTDETSLLYQDVLPLPIGVLVDEEHVEICVTANTALPYSTEVKYKTMVPGQKMVQVHVYQGYSKLASECTYLGTVTVDNLPNKSVGAGCGDAGAGCGVEDGGDGRLEVTICFILSATGQLKVTSVVEGVEREENLIIDNIFSVKGSDGVGVVGDFVPEDDFELAFYDAVSDNADAMQLMRQRREEVDGSERESIEAKILELL